MILTNKPFISVLMPVYNGERYIGKAIDSVLSQTYQHFELIIINDNSNDNTSAIIQAYKKQYPHKIKIIHLPFRHGAFGAANIAMKQAKGEFIAPMDSDDISHPKRFEKQVLFLLSHQDVIVLGTHTDLIDQNGEFIGKKNFPASHKDIYNKFFEVHPLVHPSCMIRRSMLPDYNRIYQDQYGVSDDYFTFFTFLKYGRFANVPETLFYYRIHLKNSSLQRLKGRLLDSIRIRFRALIEFGYKPTPAGVMKFCLHFVIINIMPEWFISRIYYVSKGIMSFQEAFLKIPFNINLELLRIKFFSLVYKN